MIEAIERIVNKELIADKEYVLMGKNRQIELKLCRANPTSDASYSRHEPNTFARSLVQSPTGLS